MAELSVLYDREGRTFTDCASPLKRRLREWPPNNTLERSALRAAAHRGVRRLRNPPIHRKP